MDRWVMGQRERESLESEAQNAVHEYTQVDWVTIIPRRKAFSSPNTYITRIASQLPSLYFYLKVSFTVYFLSFVLFCTQGGECGGMEKSYQQQRWHPASCRERAVRELQHKCRLTKCEHAAQIPEGTRADIRWLWLLTLPSHLESQSREQNHRSHTAAKHIYDML